MKDVFTTYLKAVIIFFVAQVVRGDPLDTGNEELKNVQLCRRCPAKTNEGKLGLNVRELYNVQGNNKYHAGTSNLPLLSRSAFAIAESIADALPYIASEGGRIPIADVMLPRRQPREIDDQSAGSIMPCNNLPPVTDASLQRFARLNTEQGDMLLATYHYAQRNPQIFSALKEYFQKTEHTSFKALFQQLSTQQQARRHLLQAMANDIALDNSVRHFIANSASHEKK